MRAVKCDEDEGVAATAAPPLSQAGTLPEALSVDALGLSAKDAKAYQTMWGAAESENGSLSGAKAFELFSPSGVKKATLKKIWGLVDKSSPRGSLREGEFYEALKLIALEQLDPDTDITTDTAAALARTGVPVPHLGALTTSLRLSVYLEV